MRLFVAIPLSDGFRRTLASLPRPEKTEGIRWVPERQMHLTLKFVGEVDEETAGRLSGELARITFEPFPLPFTSPGTFPEKGRPRVIWMGIGLTPELADLQKKVTRAAEKAGAEPEKQPYRPHVTLGRVKKAGVNAPDELMEAARQLEGHMRADRFALFESRTERTGAVYRIRQEYPAGP